MNGKQGFTLVEVLVVVAIIAILATVATPAYINYVNRSKQGQAESMLFTARLEQEEFYTDNGRYAGTIQCLPSFVTSGNTSCLTNCPACGAKNALIQYYTFYVNQSILANGATPAYYQVAATRKIYAFAGTDMVTISSNTTNPTVQNTDALKFSVFQWLFNP
jgi:type IV pilus assembly protein PilE